MDDLANQAAGDDIVYEVAVYLDLFQGVVFEVVEGGKFGAKLIDGQADSPGPEWRRYYAARLPVPYSHFIFNPK